MGLPPKKTQTAANTDWQNTNKSSVKKSQGSSNASFGPVTTNQVHGAMAKLAQNNKKMSKKARKRVATRLKAMSGSGK